MTEQPSGRMRALAEELKGRGGEIREIWDSIPKELPWLALPEAYRFDHLAELIDCILDFAVDVERPEYRRKLIEAGAGNGEQRRRDQFSLEDLFREYQILRVALARCLERHHTAGEAVTELLLRIDSGITLAQTGALRGFHRPFFEQRGEWPKVLERMIQDGI